MTNNIQQIITAKQKEQMQGSMVIFLVQGMDHTGNKVYCYLAVRADKVEEFQAAMQSGNFNPDEYGMRIVSGFGDPTESVRKMMETDYGFSHARLTDPNAEIPVYQIPLPGQEEGEEGQ